MTEKRICFVGASNVEGQGDETGKGWVGRLLDLLKADGAPVIAYRLGIRGQTLSQIVERAPLECAPRLPKDGTGLIVMTTGVNDLARVDDEAPRVSLDEITDILSAAIPGLLKIAPLVIVGPTPVLQSRVPLLAGRNRVPVYFGNDAISEANERYRVVCDKTDASYLNVFDPLLMDDAYGAGLDANEGLHTNAAGYAAMAEYIYHSPQWRRQIVQMSV